MRVLLAVDASPASDLAVQQVVQRFAPARTDVRIVHAVEWMKEMPRCFEFGQGPTAGHDVVASRNRSFERVGSHGRHGLDRLLLGSVAEAVLRHASCSVQIVRPPLAA
jgi:nucleotide-binding universal stress UspA family protein